MTKSVLVWIALAALLIAPLVPGHPAAAPAEYETRLLADYSDDYFGGDVINGAGYDLHALDVREVDHAALGESLVFVLVANGAGAIDLSLSFGGPDGAHSYGWSTTDGTSWTLQGFAAGGHAGADTNAAGTGPDGERFNLEGIISLAGAGLTVGDVLDGFFVSSSNGGNEGDALVRCDAAIGGCTDGDVVPYEAGTYTVAGPSQYIAATLDPSTATLELDTERLINLEVSNLLSDHAQTVTLSHAGGNGATARFHDPSTGDYQDTATVELGGDAQTLIHLAVTGTTPGASDTITVRAVSDLGGTATATFTYTIPAPEPDPTSSTSSTTTTSEDAPAAGLLVTLGLLAVAVLRRRS